MMIILSQHKLFYDHTLATITARRYRFALRSRCTVKQAKVRSFVTPYCEMRGIAAFHELIS